MKSFTLNTDYCTRIGFAIQPKGMTSIRKFDLVVEKMKLNKPNYIDEQKQAQEMVHL
jgi:hypothetical protein